jgi:hypothetical protein
VCANQTKGKQQEQAGQSVNFCPVHVSHPVELPLGANWSNLADLGLKAVRAFKQYQVRETQLRPFSFILALATGRGPCEGRGTNRFPAAVRMETPMAMTMTGEVQLPADRQAVWDKLNDPLVLKACIPGCESMDQTENGGFSAVVKLKVGPVSATFKGHVELQDLDQPNSYTIVGQGEGGIAGFAKGGAKVTLSDAEAGGTLLRYDVEANVGGKIAQLGARLIDGVAKKNADTFFANFVKQFEA